jgi:hypothetical protein
VSHLGDEEVMGMEGSFRLDPSENAGQIKEWRIIKFGESEAPHLTRLWQRPLLMLRYLDSEITRLRNKRMKLPFENVELGEMQKVQNQNEILRKEYLAGVKE